MAITLELPAELESRYREHADQLGVPLETYLLTMLERQAPDRRSQLDKWEEGEREFDAFVSRLPRTPELSDEALRRESIYADDDEV